MKKLLRVILPTMLALVLALCCLTACGGGVEGKYKVVGARVSGTEYYIGDTIPGSPEPITQQELDEAGFIELKAEGNCVVVEGNDFAEGTYKLEGDVLTITIETVPMTCKYENGKIYFAVGEGMEMIFAK